MRLQLFIGQRRDNGRRSAVSGEVPDESRRVAEIRREERAVRRDGQAANVGVAETAELGEFLARCTWESGSQWEIQLYQPQQAGVDVPQHAIGESGCSQPPH